MPVEYFIKDAIQIFEGKGGIMNHGGYSCEASYHSMKVAERALEKRLYEIVTDDKM